ncbi:MAG: serine/threonine-protein kinase [Chitinispirillaceae bacterium]|jgi:serine/threonine protein kinase
MAFLLKDYKDIQEIARGGMGKVYLATQVSLNRKVIIKEMATGLLTSATEIKRFENEARAAALLGHDNVIRIYDFGEDRGSFYISMEYVDGPDLETLLRDAHCIPEIALMIVLHALKGLNFAHQHQIIHRDIKPGNILVSKVGAVKVVDFGLAHAGAQQMHLTATDTIVGTPLYMSPEQASGEEKKNIQMDIWSVGVLLYRIITGDYPFKGDNVPAILYNIVQSKQPPIQELAPALPDDLAQNIDLCLEKDRANRLTILAPLIESLQSYFYDIGVRDTAEQIRQYITDPVTSTKELSKLLLEYHGSKGIEFEAAGDAAKAQAHLREVKKFDPAYKPVARPPEPFKRHTSSAMLKKSPLVTQKTGYHPATTPTKGKNGRRALIAGVIVALVVAAGGTAYYLIEKKIIRFAGEQAPQQTSRQKIVDSVKFAFSANLADSTKRADSVKKADSVKQADSLAIEAARADSIRKAMKTAALKKTHGKGTERLKPSLQAPAATGPTGTLKVAINPPSAEVTIDGAKMSLQEMSAGKRLQAGVHQLAARAAGYEPYSRSVTVEKGSVQIISADLSSQASGMASLHVHSYPWAEVYIDGVFQGNTPTANIPLPEGTHTVMLKRSGYKTYQETVTIGKGELRRIKVQLTAE